MTAPCVEVCTPWITSDDLVSCVGTSTNTQVDAAIAAASDVLFLRVGRSFPGSCLETVTIRPYDTWGYGESVFGGCGGVLDRLTLGGYPVTAINSVTVDGVLLDPAKYRVDDYRWLKLKPLVQFGPPLPWAYREVVVEFTYGIGPPPEGIRAATSLACEYLKALADDPSCALSPQVTRVDRQGISIDLSEPGAVENLPDVKAFLDDWNAARVSEPAVIISPDVGSYASRRGTA